MKKLQTKILISFLAIGLSPLFFASWLAVRTANTAITQEVSTKLNAIERTKKSAVERYFASSLSQVRTFSESLMVVEAMDLFSHSFKRIGREIGEKKDEAKIKRVKAYYHDQFGARYTELNDGATPPLDEMLDLPPLTYHMQDLYIASNPNPLGSKEVLDRADDSSVYSDLHEETHPVIRSYLQEYGYYDIFLVNPDGYIVYSVFKELDYATSLLTGPYRDTNFAEAFREALHEGEKGNGGYVSHVDYKRYGPSYEAPASFVASPIMMYDECIGVAVMQMPIDPINEIMTKRYGLGESGESYIVGSDYLMRSDSYQNPDQYSVSASFANPDQGRIETRPVREALSQKEGTGIVKSYTGKNTLASWSPLQVGNNTWAIITEIGEKEAFAQVSQLKQRKTLIAVIGLVLIVASALLITRNIMKPIGGEPSDVKDCVQQIAKGDLSISIQSKEGDTDSILYHTGAMAAALRDNMQVISEQTSELSDSAKQLNEVAHELQEGSGALDTQANQFASTGEELSATIVNISESAEQSSMLTQNVAGSVEQMSASIQEVATSSAKGRTVAEEANRKTGELTEDMQELEVAAQEIGKVVEIITNIAEQTNLLALNATIEAASAGDAGKGFAVVANEVKELARKTTEATNQIGTQIQSIQGKTQNSTTAIEEVAKVIENVNGISQTIAAAVEQQTATTREISQSIHSVANGARMIADNIENVAIASKEVSTVAQELNTSSTNVARGSEQTMEKSEKLNALSGQLGTILKKFNF